MDGELLNPKKLSKREIAVSRIKRKLLKHIWLARIGLIFGIIIALLFTFCLTSLFFTKLGISNYSKIAANFIFTPEDQVKSHLGRTNMLILGKSGFGHEAPDLTDTVMFASLSHRGLSPILISLPRDIWIPALRAKLNSAYYWGNQKEEKGGMVLAKSAVEEIVGQPVHYAVVIDFSGFKKVIDAIGGIEVEVERGFIDKRYPIAGKENDDCMGDREHKCRYETLQFSAGKQIMDGETALKFVRSRNAEGEEGTDLARASRQEKIIQAIKEKTLSRDVVFSFRKIKALIKAVNESVEIDFDNSISSVLARRAFQTKDSLKSFVLPEEFLDNPPISPKYDNLYVFIPKSGSWNEFHTWVNEKLQ